MKKKLFKAKDYDINHVQIKLDTYVYVSENIRL